MIVWNLPSGAHEWLAWSMCGQLVGTCRRNRPRRLAVVLSGLTSPHSERPPTTSADWDVRYAGATQGWSGQPNSALVVELACLAPGRILDAVCGEGADAVWLAQRGWEVIALDVSLVALDRAMAAAHAAGVTVRGIHSDLAESPDIAEGFDLVSAQYPALPCTPGHKAERALIGVVAPGGILLVVHHAEMASHVARDAGFDPADYVSPSDAAALLGDNWEVAFDPRRPRELISGGGAHHSHDTVLRARRRS